MSQNLLQLNQDESKILINGSKARGEKLEAKLISLGLAPIQSKKLWDGL